MSEAGEKDNPEGQFTPHHVAIPTGSLRLDLALGSGGIACGQFIEISGTGSSGKTTLCQHILAEAQKMGRECSWIDTDHSFNPGYAARCGVAVERMLYASPLDAEQAFDILEALIGAETGMVAVLDSVDTLIPRNEFNWPLGMMPLPTSDNNDGERLLSLILRRLAPVVNKSQTLVVFTRRGQQQSSEAYHQLSSHLARLALKLQAGLRLRLQATGHILENGIITGQHVQVKVLKIQNISSPLRVEFDIIYGQGINLSGEVFDLGLKAGLIHHNGETFIFNSLVLGTDRKQAVDTLERLGLVQPLEKILRRKLLRTPISGER